MKYEFTEKSMLLPCILVQHLPSGDYLLEGYFDKSQAILGEKSGMSDEEWGEGDETIVEYDFIDIQRVIEEDGLLWPFTLGIVEEI